MLDDHHVIESIHVHESMQFPVEHLPQGRRLVIASRADPPWPLAGLRARGDLLEVRASDLRFTEAEAAAYLNGVMGLDLAAADIARIEGRTEGWTAALQLAALSLRDRDDPAAFIAGFAGDDRFVVDYLVDEVLNRQPHDVRTFPLETSILSLLTAPSARRSPDAPTHAGPWRRWRARTSPWSHSTTVVSGTATTTSSATSCAPASPTSAPIASPSCTDAPATGSRPPGIAPRRSAAPSPPRTSPGRRSSSSSASPPCAGHGRTRPCAGGSTRSRRRPSRTAPSSRSGWSAPAW